MPTRKSAPQPIRFIQALFGLNALAWLLLGVTTLTRLTRQYPEQKLSYAIVALLMFGNVAAMLVSAWLAGKRWKWGYFLALAVLLANILLTFTDQFGFLDLVTLLLDLAILGLLLGQRAWYLSRRLEDQRLEDQR